jgi:hypothetical protein
MANDTAALALLETGLIHAGYVDADAGFYTRGLVARPLRFVLVDPTFPRLTPGTVPAGVRRARYEIDLDAVVSAQLAATDVAVMIGDI